MALITKTTDYSIFKQLKGNRPVVGKLVERLQKSLEEENLLEYNPILVDSEMRVLDGQHRLQAARAAKVPIWYRQIPGGDLGKVIRLNSTSKNWSLADFAESYAARGYGEYQQLLDMVQKYNLTLPLVLRVATPMGGNLLNTFKGGHFYFANKAFVARVLSHIKDFTKYSVDLNNRGFAFALKKCMTSPLYDEEKMRGKLEKYHDKLRKQPDSREYMRMIENIYTFADKQKVLLR